MKAADDLSERTAQECEGFCPRVLGSGAFGGRAVLRILESVADVGMAVEIVRNRIRG